VPQRLQRFFIEVWGAQSASSDEWDARQDDVLRLVESSVLLYILRGSQNTHFDHGRPRTLNSMMSANGSAFVPTAVVDLERAIAIAYPNATHDERETRLVELNHDLQSKQEKPQWYRDILDPVFCPLPATLPMAAVPATTLGVFDPRIAHCGRGTQVRDGVVVKREVTEKVPAVAGSSAEPSSATNRHSMRNRKAPVKLGSEMDDKLQQQPSLSEIIGGAFVDHRWRAVVFNALTTASRAAVHDTAHTIPTEELLFSSQEVKRMCGWNVPKYDGQNGGTMTLEILTGPDVGKITPDLFDLRRKFYHLSVMLTMDPTQPVQLNTTATPNAQAAYDVGIFLRRRAKELLFSKNDTRRVLEMYSELQTMVLSHKQSKIAEMTNRTSGSSRTENFEC